MKLLIIFTLSAISATVNAFWSAAVQPIILSIGALFAAFDLDLQPILDVQPKLLIFKSDKEATAKVTEEKKKEDKDEKEYQAQIKQTMEEAKWYKKYFDEFGPKLEK